MAKQKTVSLSSPKGGKRGCLCDDGKYRKECCDGTLQNQGIGKTIGDGNENVTITDDGTTRTRVRVQG